MKNIHVIPTPNPSRLVKFFTNKFHLCKEILPIHDEEQYQNIYITKFEEIKEGVDQWYLDKVLNEPYNSGGAQYASKQEVIILTTDIELIKDGVQAIPDEFLDWFVKNPNCEEVEVNLIKDSEDHPEIKGGYREEWQYYEIIIPKQYPKTFKELFANTGIEPRTGENGDIHYNFKATMKQETLEEGFDRIYQSIDYSEFDFTSFEQGAKWQQQISYSEEEVRKLLLAQRGNCYVAILTKTRDTELALLASLAPEPSGKDGWVKRFKKK